MTNPKILGNSFLNELEGKPMCIAIDLVLEEEELLITTLKECSDVFSWS